MLSLVVSPCWSPCREGGKSVCGRSQIRGRLVVICSVAWESDGSHPGGYGGVRLGEALHPGPTNTTKRERPLSNLMRGGPNYRSRRRGRRKERFNHAWSAHPATHGCPNNSISSSVHGTSTAADNRAAAIDAPPSTQCGVDPREYTGRHGPWSQERWPDSPLRKHRPAAAAGSMCLCG